MDRALLNFIRHKAYQIRLNSLIMTTHAGSGHPSSALSAADIVATLFFYAMRYDPYEYENPNNDRFILSKGHASPALYAVWKEVGVIDEKELLTYREFNSRLEGHPTRRFPYAEAATGALGMGLSIGAGEALSARLDHRTFRTYVLLGDAEVAEGSIWEAAEIAAHYRLNHLIAILDDNRLGQSDESINGHHTQRYADKFAAFGWHTIIIDGHNIQEIGSALDKAREVQDKPTILIAKTLKGYGVDLFENKQGWHGKALSQEQLAFARDELKKRFPAAAAYAPSYAWKPQLPHSENAPQVPHDIKITLPSITGQEVATRKAYGKALAAVGKVCPQAVSLDADVKNSTFAQIFEEQFPDRFFQCFVAEQNMVSMGVGFDRRGKIPFISTFGSFFTHAFDQIRMAAIGQARLKLTGSHAGVSIGEDGPSQMALEDIAMMRTLPDSIVLYPCDAISTYKLVEQMANYQGGISYLRTTRMATPIIYEPTEQFPIGGCKTVRQSKNDSACVIGAGITLHEALKAYEILAKEGINIAVIDLYSVKPIDRTTILDVARKAHKKVITVEDHYLAGGIGQAVTYELRNDDIKITCLAVTELPRSGKPAELLAWAGIDADAIVRAVKKMVG